MLVLAGLIQYFIQFFAPKINGCKYLLPIYFIIFYHHKTSSFLGCVEFLKICLIFNEIKGFSLKMLHKFKKFQHSLHVRPASKPAKQGLEQVELNLFRFPYALVTLAKALQHPHAQGRHQQARHGLCV